MTPSPSDRGAPHGTQPQSASAPGVQQSTDAHPSAEHDYRPQTEATTQPAQPQTTPLHSGPSNGSSHARTTRNHHRNAEYPSVNRALAGYSIDVPNCASRINQQLRYLENMSVHQLGDHAAAFRKLFMDTLHLQTRLPSSARLHLLLETESTPSDSDIMNIDLLSLFSTTVSSETSARRRATRSLGEWLFRFKMFSDSERTTSSSNVQSTAKEPAGQAEDDADDDINNEWVVTSQDVTETMILPSWFPNGPQKSSTAFRERILQVDVDLFRHLNYDQCVFVYRGLLRTAHNRSMQPQYKQGFESNPHFRSNFAFTPFTPPWFSGKIDCRVNGISLFNPPLQFDEFHLPHKRQFRSTSDPFVGKLQGLIASFYHREPYFAVNVINYMLAKLSLPIPQMHTVLKSTQQQQHHQVPQAPTAVQSTPPHRQQPTHRPYRQDVPTPSQRAPPLPPHPAIPQHASPHPTPFPHQPPYSASQTRPHPSRTQHPTKASAAAQPPYPNAQPAATPLPPPRRQPTAAPPSPPCPQPARAPPQPPLPQPARAPAHPQRPKPAASSPPQPAPQPPAAPPAPTTTLPPNPTPQTAGAQPAPTPPLSPRRPPQPPASLPAPTPPRPPPKPPAAPPTTRPQTAAAPPAPTPITAPAQPAPTPQIPPPKPPAAPQAPTPETAAAPPALTPQTAAAQSAQTPPLPPRRLAQPAAAPPAPTTSQPAAQPHSRADAQPPAQPASRPVAGTRPQQGAHHISKALPRTPRNQPPASSASQSSNRRPTSPIGDAVSDAINAIRQRRDSLAGGSNGLPPNSDGDSDSDDFVPLMQRYGIGNKKGKSRKRGASVAASKTKAKPTSRKHKQPGASVSNSLPINRTDNTRVQEDTSTPAAPSNSTPSDDNEVEFVATLPPRPSRLKKRRTTQPTVPSSKPAQNATAQPDFSWLKESPSQPVTQSRTNNSTTSPSHPNAIAATKTNNHIQPSAVPLITPSNITVPAITAVPVIRSVVSPVVNNFNLPSSPARTANISNPSSASPSRQDGDTH